MILLQQKNFARPGLFDDPLAVLFLIAVTIAIIWFLKKKYREHNAKPQHNLPPRRDPNIPPTPDETKKATNHLRVANAFYEDVFKEKSSDAQIAKMYQATRSLMHAGALDPSVTLETTKDNKRLIETQDDLAAKFLYYESLCYLTSAESVQEAGIRWIKTDWKPGESDLRKDMEVFDKYTTENAQQAIAPAERAAKYKPNNTFYLAHLVRVYRAAGQDKKAEQGLAKGLEMAPDDIELLKLAAP